MNTILVVISISSVVLILTGAYPSNQQKEFDPSEEDDLANGDTFEDDLILTPEQESELYAEAYNAVAHDKYRWLNRTVPYEIVEGFTDRQVDRISRVLKLIESASCLKFVERTNEKDYVAIQKSNRCGSFVGRIGGRQKLSLATGSSGCTYTKTVLHELLHGNFTLNPRLVYELIEKKMKYLDLFFGHSAVGFHHMHMSSERDAYVDIVWENIKPGAASAFRKVKTKNYLNLTYDYLSVMHYTATAFSKNGSPTMYNCSGDIIDG